MQKNFVSLITLLPTIVEPYQSVNTDGATVRRYTIINNDQQAETDTEQPYSAAASSQPTGIPNQMLKPNDVLKSQSEAAHPLSPPVASTPIHKTGNTAGLDSQAAHTESAPDRKTISIQAASHSDLQHAHLPTSIQAVIKYMQRRYGNAMVLPSATSATDLYTQQGSQQSQHAMPHSSSDSVCYVRLDMQPTDPSWDAKQTDKLRLVAEFTSLYPQKGSFSLKLSGKQAHLSEAACGIVNQLIAGEAAQHAGRNTAMQQLLRFVDNRAAMLLHEAEDICLEAARRRGQNQLNAQGQAQHQSLQQLPGQPSVSHPQADTSQVGSSQHESAQQLSVQPHVTDYCTDGTKAGSRQHAPPPPAETNADPAHAPSSYTAGSAVPSMSRSQHHGHESTNPDADLANALDRLHVNDASGAKAGSSSEQDSEMTADESQWDSSASYSDDVLHSSSYEDNEASASDADAEGQMGMSHRGKCIGEGISDMSHRCQ